MNIESLNSNNMLIRYQVFEIKRIKDAGPKNAEPYGFFPIQIETKSIMNRLGIFQTEDEAIDYIRSVEGVFGPVTIVKTYETAPGILDGI